MSSLVIVKPTQSLPGNSWGHFSTVWLVKDEQYAPLTSLICCYSDIFQLKRALRTESRQKRCVRSSFLSFKGKLISISRYAETAHDEIKLLKQIAATEPSHLGHNYVVNLLDSFDHQPLRDLHVCMVMEPLGETLLTLITRNGQTGISIPIVKTITRQILLGLQFLHDHCDLVHTYVLCYDF